MTSGPGIARFGLVALLWVGIGSAQAADAEGRYAIKGSGLANCAAMVEALETQDRRLSEFGGWLTGYISALNRTEADTFDLAPWQSTEFLVIALGNFCLRNPKMGIHRAVSAMVDTLRRDRLTTRSEPLQLGDGGPKVQVYKEVLRRVQQRLKDLGYHQGTADGLYGPQTKKAIQAFQTDQGLPASGLPDQGTLKTLFYPG